MKEIEETNSYFVEGQKLIQTANISKYWECCKSNCTRNPKKKTIVSFMLASTSNSAES